MLHFIALHGYYIFYKLKARPSASQKIITRFIAILALLQWSGTELAVSLNTGVPVLCKVKVKGLNASGKLTDQWVLSTRV